MKIKCLKHNSDKYPAKLRDIDSSPKQLYTLGDINDNDAFKVAVVGSRKPTKYGRYVTETLVGELALLGVTIISGLALGIDGLAHRAALKSKGKTIAVMPCGLDKIYPASHRGLAKDILAAHGALVSEYEEGMPPLVQNFPARNRIVSGLADAVLVVEAAARSGTSITAGFALEQGKTVLAVPGNINSPMSAGTNNLIKTGAFPVTSVTDILNACGLEDLKADKTSVRGDSASEQAILDLLADGPKDGDELQKLAQIKSSEFSQALTMLEIKGTIKNQGGNTWSL